MTKHFPRNARQSFGRKYRVLMETCPDMATECGVFAGIQTARSGGTTETPCLVDRVITPSEAKSSWSSGWERMGVLRDHLTVLEVGRHTGNFGERTTVCIRQHAGTLMRHFLSQ